MNSNVEKMKIVLDGRVFLMALDNKLARTGVYFAIKNICDMLIARDDVELKIIAPEAAASRLYQEYKNLQLKKCLDLNKFKIGVDKINFLMPFHPAYPELFDIPRATVFQIVHDLAMHACPEFKNGNKEFEKLLIQSLNPKGYAICVSENTRNDLITYARYPEKRVGSFYLGVKNEISNYLKSDEEVSTSEINVFLNIPKKARYVLSLSTIEPRKNLPTSLKAYQLACETLGSDDLYFVLTGAQGWGKISGLLDEAPINIKEKIRLTGYLEDKYIPRLYEQALCLIYPSFYEGFGMPTIEAMACGTPVITSDRGSLPEVVGSYAKVFDAYDSKGMAQAITQYHKYPDLCTSDGKRAQEYVKKFTWEKSAQQIIDFIKSVNSS